MSGCPRRHRDWEVHPKIITREGSDARGRIPRVASTTIDLNPVSRVTADAVGVPGQRTFYIQARKAQRLVTLTCEKEQISTLSQALNTMVDDLKTRYPKGARFNQLELDMSLEYPVNPEFRVGQMGLGYDEDRDMIVLVLREVARLSPDESETDTLEQREADEGRTIRIFCTRAQADALARHSEEVVGRGRPICALCGKPMDVNGNVEGFCPRRNGHGDEIVFA